MYIFPPLLYKLKLSIYFCEKSNFKISVKGRKCFRIFLLYFFAAGVLVVMLSEKKKCFFFVCPAPRYGSVENYMNAIGFSHEEQMSLRRLYSLPDPASVLSELSSTDASNIPRKEKLPFLRKRGKEITSPAISSKETEL